MVDTKKEKQAQLKKAIEYEEFQERMMIAALGDYRTRKDQLRMAIAERKRLETELLPQNLLLEKEYEKILEEINGV